MSMVFFNLTGFSLKSRPVAVFFNVLFFCFVFLTMAPSTSSIRKRKRGPFGGGRATKRARPARYMASSSAVSGRYVRVRNVREPGFVDVAQADYALDTTGSIVQLNVVPQGAGTSQRVGKKIMLKSLQCHGHIHTNQDTEILHTSVLIVYDKRPTGILPAITDVLVTANSNSFNNDVNSGRFSILKRWDDVLIGGDDAVGTPQTSNNAKSSDWFLKLTGLPQVFKAAGTGAIGDIEEGALYLITVGNIAAGVLAGIANLGFRVRYIDV